MIFILKSKILKKLEEDKRWVEQSIRYQEKVCKEERLKRGPVHDNVDSAMLEYFDMRLEHFKAERCYIEELINYVIGL